MALLPVPDFAAVVAGISKGAVVCFAVEPRQNSPCLGAHRAMLRLRVAEAVYDAFFNSPVGYRAQYRLAIDHGERCNRELIDVLTAQCYAFADTKAPSHVPARLIAASLAGEGRENVD